MLIEQGCGLLSDLAVMPHDFPVHIHLETRFFPVRFDDDLIEPLAIRIVFSDDPNDLSTCRLLINGLLDRCGERL